jgi:hypothetical protein
MLTPTTGPRNSPVPYPAKPCIPQLPTSEKIAWRKSHLETPLRHDLSASTKCHRRYRSPRKLRNSDRIPPLRLIMTRAKNMWLDKTRITKRLVRQVHSQGTYSYNKPSIQSPSFQTFYNDILRSPSCYPNLQPDTPYFYQTSLFVPNIENYSRKNVNRLQPQHRD